MPNSMTFSYPPISPSPSFFWVEFLGPYVRDQTLKKLCSMQLTRKQYYYFCLMKMFALFYL